MGPAPQGVRPFLQSRVTVPNATARRHMLCTYSWFERAALLTSFRPNAVFGKAEEPMDGKRIWYPFTFTDRNARVYRVSFLVAEEATWDHRFHDLEGREIDIANLELTLAELRTIQASCDGAIGSAIAGRAAAGYLPTHAEAPLHSAT